MLNLAVCVLVGKTVVSAAKTVKQQPADLYYLQQVVTLLKTLLVQKKYYVKNLILTPKKYQLCANNLILAGLIIGANNQ